MSRLPKFVSEILTVVAGVVFLVMTVAFVVLPFSMAAHPGDEAQPSASASFHPT
jgi:hypothetical protein